MTSTATSAPPGIDDLARAVAGTVLSPGDPRLADEVAPFNLAHTPRPAVVVGATSAADVAAAVRWAADRGLTVAVQATGHGLTDSLDGAVLITTAPARHRRRRPGLPDCAGRRRRPLAAGHRRRRPHGLAPLSGSSSGVGVVGYTLGGGLGLLSRRYGFAADHVRRAELVTADGAIRTVDAETDPELFWALRGGKGNLGIVTELEFDLLPVASLYGGGIFFPGASAPRCCTPSGSGRRPCPRRPPRPWRCCACRRTPAPEPLRGQTVVHLRFAHAGPADEGAALLAPMRAAAPALIDTVADMPYAAVDAIHMDPTDPMPTF